MVSRTKLKAALRLLVPVACVVILADIIDFDELQRISLHPGYLTLAFAALLISNASRSLFYQASLQRYALGFKSLMPVTFLHNFLTSIVPFGMGHLSYIHLLRKHQQVRTESAVLSLTLFHGTKFGLLVVLVGAYLYGYSNRMMEVDITKAYRMGAVLAGLGIGGILIALVPPVRRKISQVFDTLREDIQRLRTQKLLAYLLTISLVNVGLSFLYSWLLLWAVQLPITWDAFALYFAVSNLSALLPVHGYARIGTHETIGTAALVLAGVEQNIAFQASLSLHLLELLFQAILAGIAWLILQKNKESADG